MQFNWIKEAKMASWWFTFEDLGWPDYGVEEKWHKRAETFAAAGVNCVVVFGFHFRWDYVNVIDRVHAILSRVTEICHEKGLRIVDHHSVCLNHRVRNLDDRWDIRKRNNHHVPFYPDKWDNQVFNGRRMADWRQISIKDNKPVYVENYTSEIFCFNNPDWQKSYLELIDKMLKEVPFDGVMSDDLHFFPDVFSCGCEHCRKRFRQEAGLELPPAGDTGFWNNRKNPDFLKWIELRYKWTAEHYERLRAALPDDVALWGCAAGVFYAHLGNFGFSPQLYAPHWDAVSMEVYHQFDPRNDLLEIRSEMAGFASMARQLDKPFLSIFYVKQPEDIPAWMDLMAGMGSRPWLSKQVRTENPIPEEELLKDGFHYTDRTEENNKKPVVGIRFSQKVRDRLSEEDSKKYVENYRKLFEKLDIEGYRVEVVFDEYENSVDTASYKKYIDPSNEFSK